MEGVFFMKDTSKLYCFLKSEMAYNCLEAGAGAVLIGIGSVNGNIDSLAVIADSLGFTFAHYGITNIIG